MLGKLSAIAISAFGAVLAALLLGMFSTLPEGALVVGLVYKGF